MISRFRINYRQGYLANGAEKGSARKGKRERKRNIQREREERKTGNINNPIHEASDVTHVFILAEFDSSREDYISWDCVSGEQTQS